MPCNALYVAKNVMLFALRFARSNLPCAAGTLQPSCSAMVSFTVCPHSITKPRTTVPSTKRPDPVTLHQESPTTKLLRLLRSACSSSLSLNSAAALRLSCSAAAP